MISADGTDERKHAQATCKENVKHTMYNSVLNYVVVNQIVHTVK